MAQNFTREGWVDNIGKIGKLDTPELGVLRFTILDEIHLPQSTLPTKIIHLQKVQFEDGRKELRLCYYLNKDDKWIFGRFATLLPEEDFKSITEEAKKKGWI